MSATLESLVIAHDKAETAAGAAYAAHSLAEAAAWKAYLTGQLCGWLVVLSWELRAPVAAEVRAAVLAYNTESDLLRKIAIDAFGSIEAELSATTPTPESEAKP